ncbi:hypothetical protein ABZP36_027285 [Zizania latifolia]
MGLAFGKLFSRLFAKKEMQILMVGLDAVGKATILYKLKLGEIVTTITTIGPSVLSVLGKLLRALEETTRAASYKAYSMEGKVKASLPRGLRMGAWFFFLDGGMV